MPNTEFICLSVAVMEKSLANKNSSSSPSIVSNTVESVSSKLFPNIDFTELGKLPHDIGSQLTSSLPLQIIIHYSAFYFPAWLSAALTILYIKVEYLSVVYQYVVCAVFIALPPLELARLHLAYTGNTYEKVPELAGSWLVCGLLQLPLLLFVMFAPGCLPTPVDYPLHGIYLVLLLLHLLVGRTAITNMAAHQARLWHLHKAAES